MADITEQQVYEALGLGAQAQEPAEPAADRPDTDAADPETEAGAEEGDGGNQPQTPEQRRANAARRRRQEQQAAIDQAVEAARQQERDSHDAQMKDFFAKAGLKNTITGAPITNMDEFNSWSQQFEQAKLQRELKAGKLTPEALTAAIGNHPIIKQAQQLIDQDAAGRKAQEDAAAKARIDEEIAQIHAIDASVNSLEDLSKAPYWPQLYAMTKKGYSIKDAHFLLNYERLEQAKNEAAREQALANARGKNHMTPAATPRGGGSITVPAADLAMFRQFNPNATDAQIQAYYNKYMKG